MPSTLSIITGMKFAVILQLVCLLLLLLMFPDGTFGQQQQQREHEENQQDDGTTMRTIEGTSSRALATAATVRSEKVPTCQSLVEEEKFYFPNDCVSKCADRGGGEEFDTDRSRNVNGKMKCYCVGNDTPICTDEPTCADVDVSPGTAFEDCLNNVCLINVAEEPTTPVVAVTDEVEYAGDPSAANKDQTHFIVSCSCDGGKTTQCGFQGKGDYVLFSDLTYLPACIAEHDATADKVNYLDINSQLQCSEHCVESNKENFAAEGRWEMKTDVSPPQFKCVCVDKDDDGRSAVACDDSTANYNDGSRGGGSDCYETVGVNEVDCNPPESSSSVPSLLTFMHVVTGVALFVMHVLKSP